MYIKYILSILILASSLFAADIEVIESFGTPTVSKSKATPIISEIKPSATIIQHKPIKVIKKRELQKKAKKQKKLIKKSKIVSKKIIAKTTKTSHTKKKAKLLIIIDDVSHRYQLNQVKNLPFKATPSIFPPTKMNMHSYKLARGLKHFMVHLPLESHSKQMNTIYKLIRTNYTKKQIDNRVKEIRHLFPNAKYINNHTGSKFSANYKASKRLYKSLLANGFKFVDSRTSINTKFPKIAREFHKRYLKSDLFIDNVINVNSIKKEIRKGVALAKRRGYAVVIGHPHPQTLKALRESSKLINSVKTVYVDEF